MDLDNVKTNKPLVAICIPTYEKIEYVQRLMESIRKQKYNNYIVIITDDSRTKNIEEYIETLRNCKVFYHHNTKQEGAPQNTNNAINLALKKNAEIIKIMFQDDWFTYDYSLEKMVHKLYSAKTDVIFTGNFEVFPNKTTEHICLKEEIKEIESDVSFLFRKNCLGAPSNILYKSEVIYFDPAYTWLLDVDFYLRLLPGKKLDYIYEPLISIGHDGEQLTDFYSQNPGLRLKETFGQYRKYKWLHNKRNRFYVCRYVWDCCKIIIKKNLKKYKGK